MAQFGVQMIDNSVSSQWWKQILEHFVRVGDVFEIRCWKEERSEIERASRYGRAADDRYEVSVKGTVSKELLEEWLMEEPADQDLYHKMTKYFTIHVKNERCDLWSEHYGTELVIDIESAPDIDFFERVMEPYSERFSIGKS